ncbi:MAG TPA: cohesin domain-containing protein [Bryobacteraceae bacterium]|nr:cohesin domain-containing protein [Bryobacteraceae bacterium]
MKPLSGPVRASIILLMACLSGSLLHATSLTISPATGTEQVGQPFTLNVSVAGLNPAADLYDYTFDLQFDPHAFEVLAANDGTIFNYAGNAPFYMDGAIDNVNGFVTFHSGIDTNAGFTGTGGLLGSFTFEALKPFASTPIAVQNVSLSTFNAASNLLPPDIDPGKLPTAILTTVSGAAVPEPGTGVLAIIGCLLILPRRSRRA